MKKERLRIEEATRERYFGAAVALSRLYRKEVSQSGAADSSLGSESHSEAQPVCPMVELRPVNLRSWFNTLSGRTLRLQA